MFVVQSLLALGLQGMNIYDFTDPDLQATNKVISVTITWLYDANFECSALQATPGKMVLNIIVTTIKAREYPLAGRQRDNFLYTDSTIYDKI